ncbi:sensor histidine kinase [Phenylobacterium immobile]|uniref:sensor histidine kinase n=1 Tax=Phenylobacterium immobile TaxID=21 RepID=UPI000B82A598|nr:HWE histidine kinase domain-containing protein [Phenylobacterium immobile]
MDALFLRHDWSTCPEGAPAIWSQGLRQAVATMLSAAHPMAVFWGPQMVFFYNDALRQSLGPEKHPRALGQPLRIAFPESHPILEPEFARVLAGQGAAWRENRRIPMHRHGVLTDAYWTYSANPIEDGEAVAGVLFIGQEITGAVRREAVLTAEDTALRLALESGRLGHWRLDLVNGGFECSASCKVNFGRNPHAGFTFDDLQAAIHAEDQDRAKSAMARAIERGEDYDVEVRVPRSDGRESWLLMRGRVAYGGDGGALSISGVSMDVTGRRRAEEHLRLMIDELNHRVKNTLATVQSISRQTIRGGAVPEAVRDNLDSRLLALSAAHDVLTSEQWSGADLTPIAARACEPFGGPPAINLSGPSVRLSPRIAIALALALHELCTNAAKYGALSRPTGRVRIEWRFKDSSEQPELEITWRESGGPPVTPPSRQGFGSRLIQRSLAAEMGGQAYIDYAPEGVVCRLGVRLSHSVLKAKGTRFRVSRDGESWTVADGEEVLAWFETQADAIAYLTDQLNALRVKGHSGTVVFDTAGASDPPPRTRRGSRPRLN